MMRVWVVRHGQSETNEMGIWGGQSDAPLTEKGKADARRVGMLLESYGVCFDAVYASDLTRAKTTAQIALPNETPTCRADLREIDVGDLTGTPYADTPAEVRARAQREGYGFVGGEAKAAFRARLAAFLDALAADERDNVAVFAHAGVLREMYEIVVGGSFSRAKMCCNNCATAIFEYENGTWRLHSWINLI